MKRILEKIKNYRGSKKTRFYLWFIIYILVMVYFIELFIVIDLQNKIDEMNNQIIENATEIEILKSRIETIEELNLEEIEVCAKGTAKTYMSYKAITDTTSNQYRYIKKYMSVNDKGLLVDDEGYIGVALGSYFGEIGSKYIFTLSTGKIIKVVKIEAKADEHTNNGCEQKWDRSVIEFVVDTTKAGAYYGVASNGYILSGNFNNHNDFKGDIVEIRKVVD